jgi:hypothetical protein
MKRQGNRVMQRKQHVEEKRKTNDGKREGRCSMGSKAP